MMSTSKLLVVVLSWALMVSVCVASKLASASPNGCSTIGWTCERSSALVRTGTLHRRALQSLLLRGGGGDDSTRVKHVSSVAAFDDELAAAGSSLVVVDFGATWCGPCKMIAPVYDDMSTESEFSNVVFLKVDVDEMPEIAQRYQVMAMPTFLFIKNSIVAERFSGASIDKLRATTSSLL